MVSAKTSLRSTIVRLVVVAPDSPAVADDTVSAAAADSPLAVVGVAWFDARGMSAAGEPSGPRRAAAVPVDVALEDPAAPALDLAPGLAANIDG